MMPWRQIVIRITRFAPRRITQHANRVVYLTDLAQERRQIRLGCPVAGVEPHRLAQQSTSTASLCPARRWRSASSTNR